MNAQLVCLIVYILQVFLLSPCLHVFLFVGVKGVAKAASSLWLVGTSVMHAARGDISFLFHPCCAHRSAKFPSLIAKLSGTGQMFTHFTFLSAAHRRANREPQTPGLFHARFTARPSVEYWHSLRWSGVLTSHCQAAGEREEEGLQMAAELEDVQEREDELTLSAACRWSSTAPASAHRWGCRRWSTTGTPPWTASRRLKGDKPTTPYEITPCFLSEFARYSI